MLYSDLRIITVNKSAWNSYNAMLLDMPKSSIKKELYSTLGSMLSDLENNKIIETELEYFSIEDFHELESEKEFIKGVLLYERDLLHKNNDYNFNNILHYVFYYSCLSLKKEYWFLFPGLMLDNNFFDWISNKIPFFEKLSADRTAFQSCLINPLYYQEPDDYLLINNDDCKSVLQKLTILEKEMSKTFLPNFKLLVNVFERTLQDENTQMIIKFTN